MSIETLTCVVCEKVHDDLDDVLYPLNRLRTVWNIYCNDTMGGCGRIVYGSTKEEVIIKWSNGHTDETISN